MPDFRDGYQGFTARISRHDLCGIGLVYDLAVTYFCTKINITNLLTANAVLFTDKTEWTLTQ